MPARQYGEQPDFYRGVGSALARSGGNLRARFFSAATAAPSALGNHDSIETAFNGDWLSSPFPVEHRVTGAATAGQPTTGYLYRPEIYPHYTYLYSSSGYNHATDSNTGRTGICAHQTRVYQSGGGDLAAYNAIAFGDSTRAGSTSFLANPAVVLFNGQASAGVAGLYLNAGELSLVDNGYDVAGVGWVVNMNRTNVTGAKGAYWAGFRSQSIGTEPIDIHFSGIGEALFGLELSFSDFTGGAAISTKAGQYWHGNVTATDTTGLSRKPSAIGTDKFGHDGTDWSLVGGFKFGTFTGGSDVATNGFITIKDAAGNSRKLMVCA